MSTNPDQLNAIYEDPYRDRILFISSSFDKAEQFLQVLILKGYCTEIIDLHKAEEKEINSYDLVCLFLDSSELIKDGLAILKKKFLAPTIPCLIISEGKIDEFNDESLPSVILMSSESSPSEFIVKVALQLRLRKARFETVSEQVSIVSENASLRALTNQFSRDIEEAKEIHDRLLPRFLPQLKSAALSSLYLPLEAVGGDIYDVWNIDDDNVGVFMADVTGHGLPAAFIGAMIKMLLRIEKKASASQQLAYLDSVLVDYLPETRFATAISLIYNQNTHQINVSRAGHTPLLLYRKRTNEVIIVEPKGPPLTLGTYIPFEEYKTELESGDKILIYTDGLTEVMNMSGELLGTALLAEKFSELCLQYGINEIIKLLHDFQESFSGGRTIKDDLTILGLEQK